MVICEGCGRELREEEIGEYIILDGEVYVICPYCSHMTKTLEKALKLSEWLTLLSCEEQD